MTLDESTEILKDYIVGNGLKRPDQCISMNGRAMIGGYISWTGEAINRVLLDGNFTPDELEAIAVYMKARSHSLRRG